MATAAARRSTHLVRRASTRQQVEERAKQIGIEVKRDGPGGRSMWFTRVSEEDGWRNAYASNFMTLRHLERMGTAKS
jgi:hypothetical protein